MEQIKHPKGKIYYSMGEVAEMFDVNQSLIRYWESKFDILKPHKNKKGNRMFTPQDVDSLKLIYHLVKEKGMTLAGAQKRLKENKEGLKRDLEVVDRLLAIRSMLHEIRQELKMGGSDVFDDEYPEDDEAQEILTASEPDREEEDTEKGEDTPEGIAEENFTVTDIFEEAPAEASAKDEPAESLPAAEDCLAEPEEQDATVEDFSLYMQDEPQESGEEESITEETVVASAMQEIFEEQELEPQYIAELSEELVEEAETAAEVMEALAALEQKEEPQRPQVYEQTLF